MQHEAIAVSAKLGLNCTNGAIAGRDTGDKGIKLRHIWRPLEGVCIVSEPAFFAQQDAPCEFAARNQFDHVICWVIVAVSFEPTLNDFAQFARQCIECRTHGVQSIEKSSGLRHYSQVPAKRLLIVYHSQSGTTSRMAHAVVRGARHPDVDGVEVRAKAALEADADDLLWADAFILGTPENFGYMSGAMKYFLDRAYYPCEKKVRGKPWAMFVRAGNDGSGAIGSIRRILKGLAVREVQKPVLIAGEFDEARLADCEELGMTMAAGLEAGIF